MTSFKIERMTLNLLTIWPKHKIEMQIIYDGRKVQVWEFVSQGLNIGKWSTGKHCDGVTVVKKRENQYVSRRWHPSFNHILNWICVTPTHIHTAPQKSKQTQLEKPVIMLADLLWDHGPEPLPSQAPPMARLLDLLHPAQRGFVRRGGRPPELNVELNWTEWTTNWTNWTLRISATWLNLTERTFKANWRVGNWTELIWSRSRLNFELEDLKSSRTVPALIVTKHGQIGSWGYSLLF